jgi:hypothetical protein
MATLTPLTVGNAAAPNGWTNAPNGALGDNSDSTFGGFNTNATSSVNQGWELGNVDSDFDSMDTLEIVLRYAWSASVSNSLWDTLEARIMAADGTTVLAAANSGGTLQVLVTNITNTTILNTSSIAFTYVNTSATKAQWDGAVVEIRITRTRSKGGDSAEQRVYEVDFTGTYTPSGPPPQTIEALGINLDPVIQALAPFSIVDSNNASSTLAGHVDESPDSPDGNYIQGSPNQQASYFLRFDFNVTGKLQGDQVIRWYVDREIVGSGGGNPVVQMDVFVDGSLAYNDPLDLTPGADGVFENQPWTPADIGTDDASRVTIKLLLDIDGLGGNYTYLRLGAIEWVASFAPVPYSMSSPGVSQAGGGGQTVQANLLSQATAVLNPTALSGQLILAQLLSQAPSLYESVVSPGAVAVAAQLLAQAPILFNPTIPSGASANIRLVVADGSAPTSGDAALKSYLEGKGHTVTYHNDETAVGDLTGIDLVVVGESCAGATVGSKYLNVTIPVITFEQAHLAAMNMAAASGNVSSQTDITITGDPIGHGFANGDLTISTSETFNYGASLGAGGQSFATNVGFSLQHTGFIYEQGADLVSGTAAGKRGFLCLKDAMWAGSTINSDGLTIFDALLDWALGVTQDQTVIAQLIANGRTLFNPTASPGAVAVVAQLLENPSTQFNPSIQAVSQIVAQLINNSNSLFDPKINQEVKANLLNNLAVLFDPSILQLVKAELINNPSASFDPSVTAVSSVVAQLIGNGSSLFNPTISPGAVSIVVPLLANGRTLFDPSAAIGLVTISVPLLDSGNTLFDPEVSPGEVEVVVPLLDNGSTLFNPTISPGGVVVIAQLLTNAASLFSPKVLQQIAMQLISNPATAFDPKVTQQVAAQLLSNPADLFNPSIAQLVTVELLTNSPVVFEPVVEPGGVTVVVPSIDQSGQLFDPLVTAGVTVAVPILNNTPQLFDPDIQAVSNIVAQLINHGHAVYEPLVTSGFTVSVDELQNTPTLFNPTIVAVAQVVAQLISNGSVVFDPRVLSVVQVQLIDNPTEAFDPSVSAVSQVIAQLLDNGSVVFSPLISAQSLIEALSVSQAPTVPSPDISVGSVVIQANLIDNGPTVYPVGIIQDQFILALFIDNSPDVKTPRIFLGVVPTTYKWDSQSEFKGMTAFIPTGQSELKKN